MTDIFRYSNKKIEKRFETPNEARYSVLTLKASNVSGSYIAQLISKDKVVQEKDFAENGDVKFSFITPGKYSLRLIHDENGNKRWDGGSYLARRQPEPVLFLRMKNGTFEEDLRPNWDVDWEIDIAQQFSLLSHIHEEGIDEPPHIEEAEITP
jgi:hypothetical protein